VDTVFIINKLISCTCDRGGQYLGLWSSSTYDRGGQYPGFYCCQGDTDRGAGTTLQVRGGCTGCPVWVTGHRSVLWLWHVRENVGSSSVLQSVVSTCFTVFSHTRSLYRVTTQDCVESIKHPVRRGQT